MDFQQQFAANESRLKIYIYFVPDIYLGSDTGAGEGIAHRSATPLGSCVRGTK